MNAGPGALQAAIVRGRLGTPLPHHLRLQVVVGGVVVAVVLRALVGARLGGAGPHGGFWWLRSSGRHIGAQRESGSGRRSSHLRGGSDRGGGRLRGGGGWGSSCLRGRSGRG